MAMMIRNNLYTLGLFLETVVGEKPSRLRRILFFSSTGKAVPAKRSSKKMISTEVKT